MSGALCVKLARSLNWLVLCYLSTSAQSCPCRPSLPLVPLAQSRPQRGVGRSSGADRLSVLCSVQPLPKGDQVLNFSDAEDLIDDSKLK